MGKNQCDSVMWREAGVESMREKALNVVYLVCTKSGEEQRKLFRVEV